MDNVCVPEPEFVNSINVPFDPASDEEANPNNVSSLTTE